MDPLPAVPAAIPANVSEALALLRDGVAGAVLTPGDQGFSPARGASGGAAQPAAIVIAATTADVVAAVRCARAHRLRVAVRSKGHRAGQPAGGALLVDVGSMESIGVDPAASTATVAAGATWADVGATAARHGLAPVTGEWSHRSAVSDTLSGGMGWLARRHGLACDSVLRYELVTPDGLVVDVTADTHRELFWALSGAGDASLGVVTAMEIELHLARPVYAGALRYPQELAADVLDRWRAWTSTARPELTTSVVLGRDGVTVHGCWAGDLAAGRRLVDAWRAWQRPGGDDWATRPLTRLDAVNPAALAPNAPVTATMTNEWANTLRDELLAGLLALTTGDAASAELVEVRLGGGAARARSGSAANGHGRGDQYLITLAGLRVPAPAVRARLAPWVTGAAYLDRTDPAERAARARDAFGVEQWTRLEAVKAALDPAGRFRHGLAIG